jgi:hypothetical protein
MNPTAAATLQEPEPFAGIPRRPRPASAIPRLPRPIPMKPTFPATLALAAVLSAPAHAQRNLTQIPDTLTTSTSTPRAPTSTRSLPIKTAHDAENHPKPS